MKILMVIAPERFQEIEYGIPKKIFLEYGYTVDTASTVETAIGHLGNTQKTDILLKDVNHEEYDAIVFVGGGGAHFYFDHEPALTLARRFHESGRLTCAICAGPGILAKAGLLAGKKATSFPSQEENLKAKGADFTGRPVEIDGLIITANGPAAAEDFAKTICGMLK
jgi:protease I